MRRIYYFCESKPLIMSMSVTELIWALAIAALLAGALIILFIKQRKEAKMGRSNDQNNNINTKQLQLQAYERLILLTDRIALPNLITRLNQPGLSAKDMQLLLTQNIRHEFEHNITQQIYVSPAAWDAVNKLKEQNLLTINQVASFLPAEASGHDLNKTLLEMLMENPKSSLHNIVSEALSHEAKNVMR
jgi:hypothetical protein